MSQLYTFVFHNNIFYAIGSLESSDIKKINKLTQTFSKRFTNISEDNIFSSFIEEVFKNYNVRLAPVKINYVFRFK